VKLRCALLPVGVRTWLADAVVAGGGEMVDADDADVVVWTDPADPDGLADLLRRRPDIAWVQLPWAGIEPYAHVVDRDRVWTSGKGVYAEPVAEHALALALAGMRGLAGYGRARSWTAPQGQNLLGARIVILGGGGITESLLRLLRPFGADVTVVRRRPQPMEGAARTVGHEQLDEVIEDVDLVVLALALTPETRGVIDAERLRRMGERAWLVNVARGGHVVTDDLVEALRDGRIAGAGLDVTNPEPLPDGHPLWELPTCIITPHVGNTPDMAVPLLSARITENVRRWRAGEPLLGLVDADLGY
jgi:phosphoglycerate dehydrogenase-like enzyme